MEEVVEQQLTLKHYLQILNRGRGLFLVSFLIVFITTVYWTYTTPPEYEALASIMVKEDVGVKKFIFDAPGMAKSESMLNNHVEILRSRTLAREVIQHLQNSSQADSLYVLGARHFKKPFSIVTWFQSFFFVSYLEQMQHAEKPSFEQIVRAFRFNDIDVTPKRDSDIIELRVKSPSSKEAAFIANTWLEAYQSLDIRESQGEVKETKKFLETKMNEVREQLANSEEALKQYKMLNRVAELNEETQQTIRQLAASETQLQEAQTELEANNRRLEHLKKQLDESQKALLLTTGNLSSPVIEALHKQLAQQIGDKAAYEQQLEYAGYSTKTDPRLSNMVQRIEGLQREINEETKKQAASGMASRNPIDFSESLLNTILEIETENKSLQAKVDVYQRIVMEHNMQLNDLPEKSVQLVRLQREAEVNNNIFMMLRNKFEESRLTEASQTESFRVVDWAVPPKSPVKPRKRANMLLGGLVGLGFGCGLLFLKEQLDTHIHSWEDVEQLGVPVLAAIPVIKSRRGKKNGKDQGKRVHNIERRLMTHFVSNSSISESYRTLRTNLQYGSVDKPIKTILVTSPGPGDGKSTTASNLAIAFAQTGAKTLLIDADLRKPVLNDVFEMKEENGLTQVLIGKTSLEHSVQSTKVKNLTLLASGVRPRNPSEFLASKVMKSLVQKVSTTYNIVVLDSPPIGAVTDAAVLSTRVDGVVLVVRMGETDRNILKQSIFMLKKVNAKIFGIVLNGQNRDGKYGYYYDYYTSEQ